MNEQDARRGESFRGRRLFSSPAATALSSRTVCRAMVMQDMEAIVDSGFQLAIGCRAGSLKPDDLAWTTSSAVGVPDPILPDRGRLG